MINIKYLIAIAPPCLACVWWLLSRGLATIVQGGDVSARTVKRQKYEFRLLSDYLGEPMTIARLPLHPGPSCATSCAMLWHKSSYRTIANHRNYLTQIIYPQTGGINHITNVNPAGYCSSGDADRSHLSWRRARLFPGNQ